MWVCMYVLSRTERRAAPEKDGVFRAADAAGRHGREERLAAQHARVHELRGGWVHERVRVCARRKLRYAGVELRGHQHGARQRRVYLHNRQVAYLL